MERETGQSKSRKTIATVAVLVVAAGIVGYLAYKYKANYYISPRERALLEQKRKLDQLRAESKPLTAEQLNEQKKKLNTLRSGTKPLTREQLEKQKEALNKLRANSQ